MYNTVNIFLFGIALALMPVSVYLKKYYWLEVLVPAFLFLGIAVLCAIEIPNPDWIKLVPVVSLK